MSSFPDEKWQPHWGAGKRGQVLPFGLTVKLGAEKAVFARVGVFGVDGEERIGIDGVHFGSFDGKVDVVLLQDTKRIDPEVLNA